ncbi:Crp/Fnr family transcriptional regulator [Ramlibacter sp. USB13]|uniref:Crp/Fnr family transcriptional regulator n=1 Tax=Ramlibacter cellulosilyticus TaxID=2764187 RepID=A0A923MTX5_9BURK|nr:Crp/Fnr family transcriptional regulator [Ramlibacter cellulosilyticus]MBC5785330.1 Crp/Fnr family transcriptional regulator [Ramlibacter cellulosilyticus]
MKVQPANSADPGAVRANRLLAGLAPPERAFLLQACERVELPAGAVLMRPGRRATHAYFPLDAIVSLGVGATGRDHGLELALVGAEGMVGVPLLLGSTASTLRATVTRAGAAWRIAVPALQLQLRAGEALRGVMRRYVLVSLAQLAQAAWCTRHHRLEGRLARWLLMTQDRAPREPMRATHEELAAALGVRRAGVTQAAAALQERQLIAYHRGMLTLVDRAGLRAAACACYAADCASYARLMQRNGGEAATGPDVL